MDKTLMGRGDALFDQQILQLMNILPRIRRPQSKGLKSALLFQTNRF